MTLPETPYKGLRPYSEEDAPFFFGREAERDIIIANLLASRLTLLYGAAGVGKSSVLHAGVVRHLRELARRNLVERGAPELAVVVFDRWSDHNPVTGLLRAVQASVNRTLIDREVDPPPETRPFADALAAWAEHLHGDLLIILDQFDEYFLYHTEEDDEFAIKLSSAVVRSDLRASFLISIREDALSKLDRFKGYVPNLFSNYLRIDHLDRDAARGAIEKPVEEYNRRNEDGARHINVEPALTDAVLEQIRTGRVILDQGGWGVAGAGAGPTVKDTRIETPYLQLVMSRIWYEEMQVGSSTLRLRMLKDLGGAAQIVRSHLDAIMRGLPSNEQDISARVFYYLVTPSGTKIAHTVPDLSVFAEVPQAQLSPVLEKLSRGETRILQAVVPPNQPGPSRYEIFHDVLAPSILTWRAQYVQKKALARRTLRLSIAALIVMFLLILAGAINANHQEQQAKASASKLRNVLAQSATKNVLAFMTSPDSERSLLFKGLSDNAKSGLMIGSAITLRQKFHEVTLSLKKEYQESDFTEVRGFILFLQYLDVRNGHALYYEGEVRRAIHRNVRGPGDLQDFLHEPFFRYLEVEQDLPTSERGGRIDAEVCYERPQGYCRQRTGWINHLLTNDFYEDGLLVRDRNSKRQYFEKALGYAKASANNYPPGFVQLIPSAKLEADLQDELKALRGQSGK